MLRRSTYVVSSRLGERRVRDSLASAGSVAQQVTTLPGLASRLVGGFTRPVSGAEMRAALQGPPEGALTSLHGLSDLPGFARAATRTLTAAWQAGITLPERVDLGGRWAELAALERHVAATLPLGTLLLPDLVARARARAHLAPQVTGPVTLVSLLELPPLWRRLLLDLSEHVPVTWEGLQEAPPGWWPPDARYVAPDAKSPARAVVSCANPDHEALEALRWARERLSAGRAPEDLAIAAVDVAGYDDAILTAAAAAGIRLHAAHGVPALSTPVGQVLAALTDVLARGPGLARVARLVTAARAAQVGPLAFMPEEWAADLGTELFLKTPEQWRRALRPLSDRAPEQAAILERLVADLQLGLGAATRLGERWLTGPAKVLWRRALADAPATVLERTLAQLRVEDGVDPATAVLWGPAGTLVDWPRPLTRLLGLTARAWPRRGGDEDALLPERLRPGLRLRELSAPKRDAEVFRALLTRSSDAVVISWPRRGSDGRELAPSPLLTGLTAEHRAVSARGGVRHALTEADRRAARPSELARDPRLERARDAYRAAFDPRLTAFDGVVREGHPALTAALARRHSATSLRTLLLNPHAFVARYALGWSRPEPAQEHLTLDPASLGTLLHEVLEAATRELARGRGAGVPEAVAKAVEETRAAWEALRPIPPAALWRSTLHTVASWARWALEEAGGVGAYPESYAELRFGERRPSRHRATPWATAGEVVLPGTDLRLTGVIDRLDIDRENRRLRVVDYKSGRAFKQKGGLEGGKELQRTLYAVAVRQLLGGEWEVEAVLLFPRDRRALPLDDPDAHVGTLSSAVLLALDGLSRGLVIAGPGLDSGFEETRIAFPAYGPGWYLYTKWPAIAPERQELDSLLGAGA